MGRRGIVPWLVGLLMLMAVGIGVETTLLFGAYQAETEKSEANESAALDGADLADQVTAACERDDPTGQSVRDAGLCQSAEDTKESIVDTIDPSTPTPSPSAKPLPPSQTQVLTAVSVLLPPAVRDSVFMLLPGNLDAYCALRNGCIGRAGEPGINGTTPSDERLLGLIRPLIPPPPRDGIDGTDGAPGRGIVSGPTCQADGTWSTSFTDGTVEVQPGPCRVDLITEPPTDPPVEVLP